MKERKFKDSVLRHLLIVSILLFLVNTSISFFWLARSNTNMSSTSSIEKSPDLSWEIAWDTDGEPICSESNDQLDPQICDDGAGGAIIAWVDERDYRDIYAQRIDSTGVVQWTTNGESICTADGSQTYFHIIGDGVGGAIIAWTDHRNGNWDIYTQRINSNGDAQWTPNGTAICTASETQISPKICSDGAGGAIITWGDDRGPDRDIYTQRINSTGSIEWTTTEIEICTAIDDQEAPQIISDEAGGAIIMWQDYRNGADYDIYAQRINSTGVVQWTTNGESICTADGSQTKFHIIGDGAGGAIIIWQDYRNGADYDIYAQRINSNGDVQWTTTGIEICTGIEDQTYPQIISDEAGGAIITWHDLRDYSTSYSDIYAQRINSTGNTLWTYNGIGVCTDAHYLSYPQICGDGAGGAIITWREELGTELDIYAQRINSNGDVQWTPNGTAICTAPNIQIFPQIISDGAGSAIITWQDKRYDYDFDIYAQRIKNSPPTSSHPGDIITSQDGSETINWTLYGECAGGKYRVLANDTNGNYYIWRSWTIWLNNIALNIPINRSDSGFFNYTIEYYDDLNVFGIPDTVIIKINETVSGDGTDNGDETGKDVDKISGYNILILLISGLIIFVIVKRKLKPNGLRLNSN